MLLGTQWYILFNVIAGAIADPFRSEGSRRALPLLQRCSAGRLVILPGIFPYLVTGLVTASGGAWNASIIAEYFHLQGPDAVDPRPRRADQRAPPITASFDVLLMATIIMALMVVTINRLVWRPLFQLAETKYRLEG